MVDALAPDPAYDGREHSRIKHLVLEAYLERLVMIVGQRFDKIAYVDGFAGPWKYNKKDYSDTSFGIALRVLEGCRQALQEKFKRDVRMRALFIDEDVAAAILIKQHSAKSDVWVGDFAQSVGKISKWIDDEEFAFVFVDPFGWKGLVTPATLAPLLRRRNTELLINVMWDHINLATGHGEQKQNLVAMFGEEPLAGLPTDVAEKRKAMMDRYRALLKKAGNSNKTHPIRTAMFPVEYTEKNAVRFYLVYATHNPVGLLTFLEESENTLNAQHHLKFVHKLRKKEVTTGMPDLFGPASAPKFAGAVQFADAMEAFRARIAVAGGEIRVTDVLMADLAESTDLLPSELQQGVHALLESGEVENPSIKGQRRKNWVNWRKQERLIKRR